MKTFALVLLCSLACVACGRSLTTLPDGQPGYAITCDTFLERCIETITHACRGKGYTIISERTQEWRVPLGWVDGGGPRNDFNSRYWMEVRCDP